MQYSIRSLFLSLALSQFVHCEILFAEPPAMSGGTPVVIEDANMSITPPIGWEVQMKSRGKALIMQPPASTAPIKDYSKPLYTRNVTLAVSREARPIDETEAKALRAKLEKEFGEAPGVKNFQVVEHRFIDYRDKADAILVYTAFDYNGFPMSQMHILVSGDSNSALLTYTDLADEFQKNEAAMNQAWTSMLSIEVLGKFPKRYHNLIPAAVFLALGILSALALTLVRRRNARRFIDAEEDNLYSDDTSHGSRRRKHESSVSSITSTPYTKSQVWGLQSGASRVESLEAVSELSAYRSRGSKSQEMKKGYASAPPTMSQVWGLHPTEAPKRTKKSRPSTLPSSEFSHVF